MKIFFLTSNKGKFFEFKEMIPEIKQLEIDLMKYKK